MLVLSRKLGQGVKLSVGGLVIEFSVTFHRAIGPLVF